MFVVVRSFIIITIIIIMIIMIMISRLSAANSENLMKPPDNFHPSPSNIAVATTSAAEVDGSRHYRPFGARARLIRKKKRKKDMKRISYRKLRSASLLA